MPDIAPVSSESVPVVHFSSAQARAEELATRVVFLVSGLGMATWAPLVPFAKARAQVDEGTLGLLLLCLGAGSVVAMPLAGIFTSRLGCRVVITVSALMMCAALPLLASLSSFPLLMASLLLFGAGVGALDVSMNIQAIIVERASGKTMMSGIHGMFSLGGIVGASGMAALLGLGASPLTAVACVVVIAVALLAFSFRNLLTYGSKNEGPFFAVPHGIVLFIGIICFILFLTEGAMLDWSAVFLSSVHKMEESQAGLGYAAFATTMTFGRLTGDMIVHRLGGSRVIAIGGLCAASGIAISTFAPSWQVALAGYALVGAGCSNIVPVLFSAAGRQTAMPESIAVPAITTLGYAGILAGPAAIGFVAHIAGLPAAFVIISVLLIGVACSSRFLKA